MGEIVKIREKEYGHQNSRSQCMGRVWHTRMLLADKKKPSTSRQTGL
jgi:hypothetical protein